MRFFVVLSKMCVSTQEYRLMLGKNLISQLEIAEKSCYYPPPTESRRLLEITEKTQEIQQPQLGSSVHVTRANCTEC